MSYEKVNKESEVPNITPIKIIPFIEDFKVDLYHLYKVYRPEQQKTDSYYDN